ncbi:Rieske (2Fe-2S) protein [Lederbergia wuyishanensis]|uniref:Nitrite reductase/ring-hydroxylating ferredoxin subunit n=1 Tax=Lederbergia wuyishanensis TaxID=1347903 RepID=A0ABU0D4L9_9BACI|nr:Rieske 2Fe-2S domain-containing protein [Lederbergia wuyishanensis]MCJ8008076.1 Rieske 2Fe-2S domain-containing protein [Lederbergia wuyishanensis]MDQ0343339.1 nitrite reductase/ring-hydroxylating ferredoxin subunit [Lederbergia wuyishanensis]
MSELIYAGSLKTLEDEGAKVIKGGSHAIAVFVHEKQVYAVDNRCPHMGFPLHTGSLCNGILTCHWHHARFDIKSGGTLDPWADDVATYPVEIKEDEVWVNPVPYNKVTVEKLRVRLREGLEQNLSLVIAKSVVGLMEAGFPATEIAQVGVEFGTTHHQGGWGSGLTILTAMTNILPKLDKTGQILGLFQGLVHVARESSGRGTRFLLGPLPVSDEMNTQSFEQLSEWYRHCVEVRDSQGAERVLLTAIELGFSNEQLADMMMTAITDHFYVNTGHTVDFHNKAFEILNQIGFEHRPYVLSSLLPGIGNISRSEESHSWQSPVNLVKPLMEAFQELPDILANPLAQGEIDVDEAALVKQILSDNALKTVNTMLDALKTGISPVRLAQLVALAAAERISRFHVQNEFNDWITALHTFTHAHAVHETLRRSTTPELTRAVFHGAMSVYLDRFLNTPSARRPEPKNIEAEPQNPAELLEMMNQQQQVTESARWVVNYLARGGDKGELFNTLGHALLREDAEFHSFQMYEAAMVEHERWEIEDSELARHAQETLILAVTRYLAGHAPTARETPHTARIAMRLHRGEKLFEDE